MSVFGVILVAWLACGVVLALQLKSPWGFLLGLVVAPSMIESVVRPKLFPYGEMSFPEGSARCNSTRLDLDDDLRWSDVELRTRQGNTYFGWGAPVSEKATIHVYRPFTYETWGVASAGEWNNAAAVPPREVDSEAGSGSPAFVYQGKTFRPAGSKWLGGAAKAAVSPDGKNLALFSFDGPSRPTGLYFLDVTQKWWNLSRRGLSRRYRREDAALSIPANAV